MMGHQSRQMAMIFVDMESLIPEKHLLRKIDQWYPLTSSMIIWHHIIRQQAGPSVGFRQHVQNALDWIPCMVLNQEQRLVEEVRLNIAYRWFCGFELDDAIPDHFHIQQNQDT